MDFAASWKDRKGVAPALRTVYRAADAATGQAALEDFAQGQWGSKYPAIAQSWHRNWELVIPFFAFPEDVRRSRYTTNAIEALNSKLRRAVRTRGHFPSDDAATKLLYLVLNNAVADRSRPERRRCRGRGEDAIRRHVQRALRARMMETASHRNPDSPVPSGIRMTPSPVERMTPSDDAATKLLYLVLNHAVADWKRPRAGGRGEDAIRRHVQRALRARVVETASHRNPDAVPARAQRGLFIIPHAHPSLGRSSKFVLFKPLPEIGVGVCGMGSPGDCF